jgi:superfamily II DNA or RNA helicase
MVDIKIKKKNEVYLTLECEPHIKYELSEYFTFDVPEAKFMPQFRNRLWDGKIRLFSPAEGQIYCGLYEYLIEWINQSGYSYEELPNEFFGYPREVNKYITPEAVAGWVKNLGIPFKVRDYQYRAIYEALKYNRRLLLSPTSSGKSLMIYCIVRYHVESNNKVLIIVPTTSLVEQLYKDFQSYGWNSEYYCHKIYSGYEKTNDKEVVITTWQSIYKLPKQFFKDFNCVIGDEAHQFKAKSLISIMTKLHDCKHRIGFTGTLDGTKTNKLVLEGLFGKCNQVTKTKDLIDKGHISKLKIKILMLQHQPMTFESYQEEMECIVTNPKRNKFISKLVNDLSGNSLVLFNYVEKHGEPLFELINNTVDKNKKVFFVHGGVETEEREKIRELTEKEDNCIIIASYGTFSTGINIKNLHNVIFASPSKSRIRNLQSIGRVLRKGENKNRAVLYDISDDFSKNNKLNYTLRHLMERIKIYNEEDFDYEMIPVKFKD